jgi:hypothetical protein
MDHVGSTRKGTAKRAKTASSNISMNLALPLGARLTGSHPTRRGRKAKRTAKQRTARIRLLPEVGAQIRRAMRKIIKINLLPGHPRAAAGEKAKRRQTIKRMPRLLWRYLL